MEKNKKKFRIGSLLILMAAFSVFNFNSFNVVQADEIEKTQDEIESLEKKLKKEEQSLNIANSNYTKVSTQVNTTASLITQAANEISRKEAEIKNLNDRIALFKKMLSAYLQEIYFSDQDPIIKLAVTNESLEGVFGNIDRMASAKERILTIMDELTSSQLKLDEVKGQLAEKKEDHEKLLQQKRAEQGEIIEDIQEAKAAIGDLRKKLAEMQSDLAKLTGKSYNAKDIQEAVEYASKSTGVPKGVLYGFLKKETNLGANTGQCTYEQVEDVAIPRYKKLLKTNKNWQASIDLLYKRKAVFYEIVKSLGYSKDKKVSCSPPPSAYIGQGGAMGVSQFMSDVWRGYESQITAMTGHSKPDPWNLTDGVMAMALKVKKAGGTSDSSSAIKQASINYLGTYNKNYYEGIVYWSKNYKTLFPD